MTTLGALPPGISDTRSIKVLPFASYAFPIFTEVILFSSIIIGLRTSYLVRYYTILAVIVSVFGRFGKGWDQVELDLHAGNTPPPSASPSSPRKSD